MLNAFLAPRPIKEMYQHAVSYLDAIEESRAKPGVGSVVVAKEARKLIKVLIFGKPMRQIIAGDNPPNIEHQALHSIAQVVYHLVSRAPLVDVGNGSFCSAELRNVLGMPNEACAYLRELHRGVLEQMVRAGLEKQDSEYVTKNGAVIDEATASIGPRF